MSLPSVLPRLRIPESDSSSLPRGQSYRRTGAQHMQPSLSPVDIQSHLYNSLLEARTADVALRVRGTWEAVYRLHRVVLIQAGFFRSLFTSGFVESKPKSGHRFLGQDEIDIVFDDHNITRAAFEICIARLYGGGPPLHVSPALIPTPSVPLTHSFPGSAPLSEPPAGYHPATPRFLLSLLATAVYLSIPFTVSQALNSIVGSVGPHTVVQYLNFAIGRPIEDPDVNEPEAAVGLEKLAEPLLDASYASSSQTSINHAEESEEMSQRLEDLDIKKEDPSESLSDGSEMGQDETRHDPFSHYGAVSDKIGEAAACWLARWGPDMLAHEEALMKEIPVSEVGTRPSSLPVRAKGSAVSLPKVPTVWRRGGLNPKWIRALVSSDALFVKGERERYDFAKSVVDLRRATGIDSEEEDEWTRMFSSGIYYLHMSLDDVIFLSQDISPHTGRLYVPLSVLQAAHWSQSLLRHQITAKPSSGASVSPPSSPPPPRDKDLGLAISTPDILANLSSQTNPLTGASEREKVFYPIPADSSVRLGDSGGIEGHSMDQLFELSSHTTDSKTGARLTTSESNFFGLLTDRNVASSCVAADPTGKMQWSPYPPFRFAVEFWDVDSLKEKSRLHSHTVWYAGSLFNVYVQVVRKKGVQLGVYLHRQSSIDPIPGSSAPHTPTSRAERTHTRGPSLPQNIRTSASTPSVHYSPSIHPSSRSTTPVSSPVAIHTSHTSPHILGANSIPATAPPVTPPQPYRDPRSSVSAHFTISCASATGSALTRFTSAPDVFSISQSWGWKSSSLRTEEYLEVSSEGEIPIKTHPVTPSGREISFRATVVLGMI